MKGKRNIVAAHGLPAAKWQQKMTLDGVYREVDAFFVRQRVILEFDGELFHNDGATIRRDRQRRCCCVGSGYNHCSIGVE